VARAMHRVLPDSSMHLLQADSTGLKGL